MTAQFQFFQSLPHKKADFVKKSRQNMGYCSEKVNHAQCNVAFLFPNDLTLETRLNPIFVEPL